MKKNSKKKSKNKRNAPGQVRDAITQILKSNMDSLTVKQIEDGVGAIIGPTPRSSIRSYLNLNTPNLFIRQQRGSYQIKNEFLVDRTDDKSEINRQEPFFYKNCALYHGDCLDWIKNQKDNFFHAVVTDPPYGLYEYSQEQQLKLRNGKGGVWRIPPSFDGHVRSPLPRFTTLTKTQREELRDFFYYWAIIVLPKLVPGANVIVASNPLFSYIVSSALSDAGLERRGEIIRLVMTMRGGDRPKDAHYEFSDISVIPRSMWEPWLLFRKPIEGRIQDNLRKWKTGGFRRPSNDKPFGDVIVSSPTRNNERKIAQHPSLKPQSYLRQLIRAVLPLGQGIILDPFAGSGSTLAAAEIAGYSSIGVEKDVYYFNIAKKAIPKLINYNIDKKH